MDTNSLKTEKNLESVSRLYNLEPIGIGTSYTECLKSYVTRLAEAHNVTLGTLIGKEITPILNKHYLNKVATRGGGGLFKSASSINGVKSAAVEMLKSLEQLTFPLLTSEPYTFRSSIASLVIRDHLSKPASNIILLVGGEQFG